MRGTRRRTHHAGACHPPPRCLQPCRRPALRRSQQLECTRRVLARAACSLENWHGPKDAFAGIDNFIIYTLGGAAGASLHSLFHGLITFNAVFPPESLEQAGVSVLYDHTDTTVRAHLVTKDGALNSDDGEDHAMASSCCSQRCW